MRLLPKSLVFLLSILALQLVVFGGLSLSLTRAEEDSRRVNYSNRAVSACSRIGQSFHEANYCLLLFGATGNPFLGQRFDRLMASLPDLLEDLKDTKYESKEDEKDISTMSKSIVYITDELTVIRKNLGTKSSPFQLHRLLKLIRYEVQPHMADFMESETTFSTRHRAIEKSLAGGVGLEQALRLVVGGGFLLNILAMVLTVIGFSHGIVQRLSIIADNFIRYSKKEVLNPRQNGNDEISLLDSKFHDLSNALREAADKETAAFANMPVGLITCGADGVIEAVNPKAHSLFRFTEGNFGTNIFKRVDSDADRAKLHELTLGKEATGPVRVRLLRDDNSWFPAEVSVSRFQHKEVTKFLFAVTDVSDREAVESLRQEVVAMVSHDIRSPLTSIAACLSLIEEQHFGPVSERGQAFVKTALGESRRLMKMTGELLEISKIEQGNIKLNRTECDVYLLMTRAIEALRHQARQKNLTVAAQTTELHLYADADRMIQILINYLSNAIKFSPDGAHIDLYAEAKDQEIRLCVRDHGNGIPAGSAEQIFERFKQLSPEDAKHGTVLGLAICRMLADVHGGKVGVVNSEPCGSTFWVSVPKVAIASQI